MSFDEPLETTIDQIPVWFTDVPGPCMGGLVFRTGRADETLMTAGINHMVEHLAFFRTQPWTYPAEINGSVGVLTTQFHASGSQADVEAFLTSVCESLGSLPLDRLEDERHVLETEARHSSGTFAGSASARFGARGFGLVDIPEFGLQAVGAEDIAAWAASRFSAGQAAAWLTRPPTPALRLPLPAGERLPIPVPEPMPGITIPSHIHGWDTIAGVSFTAPRSMALLLATVILRERALTSMRMERALTYSVNRFEERIGAEESMYFLILDAIEERMPTALEAFTELLQEVSDGGVTDDEVAAAHASVVPWNSTDPARPAQEATRKATACLFGRTPTPWKGLAAQGERMNAERVAAATKEALTTAILVAPEGLGVPFRYTRHPDPPRHPPAFGKWFIRWDDNRADETILGRASVTRRMGPMYMTVRFDEIEAVLLGPDGTMTLIDRSITVVHLQPGQLRHGKELAKTIMDAVPDRIVDLRRDAVGWFELQSLVESHDPNAIASVWQELELLAREREVGERILALAFATVAGWKGLVAATDRRLMHLSTGREPEVYTVARSDIVSISVSNALRGARLEIVGAGDRRFVLERVRPREVAADIAAAIEPLDDHA